MTRTGRPRHTTRMGGTLTERLIRTHLGEGEIGLGREIAAETGGRRIRTRLGASTRDRAILAAGGLLNLAKGA